LRDADLVISENGSITHNILISRNKPFYALCALGWNRLSPSEFASGGIFNSYKSYLANHIECQSTNTQSHHLFSGQLMVDLEKLKKVIG
jgi:hypothetical protein